MGIVALMKACGHKHCVCESRGTATWYVNGLDELEPSTCARLDRMLFG